MKKKLQTNHIISFIILLNKNQINNAYKMLPQFASQIYYQQIICLLDRFKASREPQKTIEQLFSKNSKQFMYTTELEVKLAQFKKKKYRQVIQVQAANKAQILDLLQIQKCQEAKVLAEKYKMPKISSLVQDLLQYRWFKSFHTMPKERKEQPLLSIQGKLLKKLFYQNIQVINSMNQRIEKKFQYFFSNQKKEVKLTKPYFSKESTDLINRAQTIFTSYKDYILQIEKQKIKILELCEDMGINLPDSDFKNILTVFLQHVKARKHLFTGSQSILKRIVHQQNNNNKSISSEETVCTIINILRFYCLNEFQSMQDTSNDKLIICIAQILQKYKQNKDLLKIHKQFIKKVTQKQMSMRTLLLKLHYQIRLRVPSQTVSPQSRNEIQYLMDILKTDFQILLQDFDKAKIYVKERMQAEQLSIKSSQDERKLGQTNRPNSQGNQSILSNSSIAQLRAKLQQMKQLNLQLSDNNNELMQANKNLKQELDEQYKLSNKQKMQNKSLMQKVKAESKIIVTPFFKESNQDQVFFLRAENQRLVKLQNEKQDLFKNFQTRLAEILTKKQKQKQFEVNKWKQKHSKAKVQIDQLYEQIDNLNKIIEQQMFTTKTIIKNMKQESQIREKLQQQEKNIQKSIIGQSVILENQFFYQQELLKEKIKSLEIQNLELKHLIQEKEKEHFQAKLTFKKESQIKQQQLIRQKEIAQKRVQQLMIKAVTHSPQNINSLHLFPPGFIFDEYDHEERLFLLKNLTSYLGPIKRTRLLYRADNYNKVNFHKYVDLQKHVVLIAKTICGKLVAGYSEESFDPQEIKKGYGMILSLWARKVFFCHKGKRAICYDDYFAIFGNSELRIRSLEFKLFSNFAIANSYYDNKGEKVNIILGQGLEREVDLSDYQFYALDLYQ